MTTARHKRICGKRINRALLAAGLIIACMGLAACATKHRPQKSSVDYAMKVQSLERALKKKKSIIEHLKEKNLVLESREQIRRGKNVDSDGWISPRAARKQESVNALLSSGGVQRRETPSAARIARSSNPEKSSEAKPPEKTPVERVGSAQTGEHFLYSKILETYRSRKEQEMSKSLQFLLKTYPESVFADNALYLAGLLAFELNDFPRAIRFFDRVIEDYPRGNKAVSAMLAKASLERRRNQIGEARRVLMNIRQAYPGSPEAARVAMELKLLDQQATKGAKSEVRRQ